MLQRKGELTVWRFRAAVLILTAAVGVVTASGTAQAAVRPGVATGCAPTSDIKPLIRGLVDRGVAPPAADLQASSINIGWDQLEPNGPGLVAGSAIDQAIASAGCAPLRIRVLAGVSTPAWVIAMTGGVSVTNPYSDTPGTAGQFWTSEYGVLYDNLELELAARYESVPNVVEFVVSRCALFYPEPFILGTSIASNNTNLLAAGYTESADQACQQEEIDTAKADWPTTRIGVSFNPYQVIKPTATAPFYKDSVDEAYTEQMMASCRYELGPRCVLENDLIRDPITSFTASYAQMYAAMSGASGPIILTQNGLDISVALGAPIAFQTATAANIGDFWGTLEWAREQHASSVELPLDGTYPTSGGSGSPAWQTTGEVSQWFEDVPALATEQVNAIQGTPTTGVVVATVTLDERAALDTAQGYGDVGSVPFDTVSAIVTWPTGVTQPPLVSVGGGTPASSVMCPIQQLCTVTILSGGYTFPEEPVTGAGSVTVTLANTAGAYIPADGADPVSAVPVNVVPAPLRVQSLTVTPARSAPTARLSLKFSDADALGVAADYNIRITWGDGSSSMVAASASGGSFTATSSHRYPRSGKDTVTVTVTDTGGAVVSASRSITLR